MTERPQRRWFGHGRTRALLATGLLLGTGAVATSAYWTTKKTVTGTSFTTGTMHIVLGSTSLNLSGMTAGSSAASLFPVSNTSTGAVAFSYRIKASATNTLGSALTTTVRVGGSVSGSTCTGGTLVGSAGAALNGFNQPAGADLAQGGAANVCIQVTLPSTATVAPGSTSTVTFTFPATQKP
ncbi:SipW-dependent-type signal peptide-containing protein [Nocardioides ultimimeridianus]